MTDLVFIDWISPSNHTTFNKSLFATIGFKNSNYYIFSKDLEISGLNNHLNDQIHTRRQRAINVLRIIFKHRKSKIVLITYDPIYVIFARIFAKRLYLIEHNTTPEKPAFWKHAIWQFIFLRGLNRLALFREQIKTLKKLQQNSIYLGSLIPIYAQSIQKYKSADQYFLLPGYRANLKDLAPFRKLFSKTPLKVKKQSYALDDILKIHLPKLQYFDFIDLEKERHNIKAMIISGDMSTRLSGWANEALGYGIPILAANRKVEDSVHNNFPEFPFLRGSLILQGQDLDDMLNETLIFDMKRIIANNDQFLKRFLAAIDE
jgi:hypothetical protein